MKRQHRLLVVATPVLAALYIAEGGLGGVVSTTPQQCEQVKPVIGPYTGGFTADILRFAPNGTRTVVAGSLPSDQAAPPRNFRSGVADIAFVGDTLYALLAGGGCSHGHATCLLYTSDAAD